MPTFDPKPTHRNWVPTQRKGTADDERRADGRCGMSVRCGRSLEEQHAMLQLGIEASREAVQTGDPAGTEGAVRNQEVQALTLIALELRELRRNLAR